MAPSTLDGGALSARPGGLPLEGGRAGAGVSEAGGLGRLGISPWWVRPARISVTTAAIDKELHELVVGDESLH